MTSITEQKANLLQKAFSGLSMPQDILFAIDGSSSVQDHQFETMKFCIRTLVNYLGLDNTANPNYRVGGIQFDTNAYMISYLTPDPITFNTAVVTMVQKKGGTSAGLALTTCLNMFAADERNPSANKTIVLMTDGDVNDAKSAIKGLTEKNVRVISIGVGLRPGSETGVVAISSNAIFVTDFTEMQLVVSHLSVKPGCPPEIHVRTRSSLQASFDVVSSTPFNRVDFEILYDNENAWRQLGAAESNVFYATGLRQNSIYKVRAKTTNGTAVSDWSKEIELRTLRENPETAILQSRDLADKIHKMVKLLEDYTVPADIKNFGIEYVNIALLGRIGNGKSAFFNTIWSVMNGSYIEHQLTKNDITTVTLKIAKSFLKNNRNNAIRLCDTYGWKGGDSWSQELEFFLDGALRDGYQENTSLLNSLNNAPTVGDRIHAVIIVYEMPSIFTDTHIDELKKFFAKMTNKGYQPIIILTKPDLIPEANITGKLESIFDTGVIDNHIQAFSTNTKIPQSNIFPVMNYCGQYPAPEWVREKLALNAFFAALEVAKTKIANDLKKHILIRDVNKTVIGTASFDGASETPLSLVRERIVQCNSGLKNFAFVSQQGNEISRSTEESISLTRVTKPDNDFSFWTVDILPQASAKLPDSNLLGIDLTVPETLLIVKDGQNQGTVLVGNINTLADLRKTIEVDLELKDYLFTNAHGTVFLHEESAMPLRSCINQGAIAIIEVNSLSASEFASEKFPLVVLNNKDKSSLGVCLVEKGTTLRELENVMAEQEIEVPTGFVFVHKGATIKPKQLDAFRVKHIMFKQEDGTDSIMIAEPFH